MLVGSSIGGAAGPTLVGWMTAAGARGVAATTVLRGSAEAIAGGFGGNAEYVGGQIYDSLTNAPAYGGLNTAIPFEHVLVGGGTALTIDPTTGDPIYQPLGFGNFLPGVTGGFHSLSGNAFTGGTGSIPGSALPPEGLGGPAPLDPRILR